MNTREDGQRKRIGLSNAEALYVVNILAEENKIIVGTKKDLIIKRIFVKDVNFLSDIKSFESNVLIKVRSTGKLIKADIKILENGVQVNLNEDEAGISPGQACVFYSKNKFGDKVLGGGWIAKTINNYLSP